MVEKIGISSQLKSFHQQYHLGALKEGLEKIGVNVSLNSNENNVSCWGWRTGKRLRDEGKNVLVMERGYIGDRFKYTSLGWNGLNNYAEFPTYENDNGERFRSHGGILKPWKRNGSYILILGQVMGDASLQGKNISFWYQEIAKKAKETWGIPVYFRPHPDSIKKGGYKSIKGIDNIGGDLQENLEDALFTIAYNSNSCLDSIINGIPCYAGDKGTMAWNLCMKSIDNLYYPDREDQVYKIAWTQWDIDEIKSGYALKKIVEMKR